MSNDENMAEAILGRDAEEFCRGELGKYLLGRSKQERQEAQEELAKMSPLRIFKGYELRNAIWRAESFEAWLVELIMNGKNAQRIMEHGTADPDV